MRTNEELAKLLACETLTEEDGAVLGENISELFNGREREAKNLYESFSPEGKRKMLICAYLALFDVARWWILQDLDGWDERKKASAIFAYRNLDFLGEKFKEMTGLPAMPGDSRKDGSYFSLMSGKNMKIYAGRNEWMLGFMSEWSGTHSTIKQSFIRFMVRDVILPSYPEHRFLGNSKYDESIVFPYI